MSEVAESVAIARSDCRRRGRSLGKVFCRYFFLILCSYKINPMQDLCHKKLKIVMKNHFFTAVSLRIIQKYPIFGWFIATMFAAECLLSSYANAAFPLPGKWAVESANQNYLSSHTKIMHLNQTYFTFSTGAADPASHEVSTVEASVMVLQGGLSYLPASSGGECEMRFFGFLDSSGSSSSRSLRSKSNRIARELESLESRLLLSHIHTITETGVGAKRGNADPALEAPSDLILANPTADVVDLSWTDNSTDETGFEVFRRIGNSGSYKLINSVASNVTSFVDSGVKANTQYGYEIVAVNGGGVSSPSGQASVKTIPLPKAPTKITATPVSLTSIQLAWTNGAISQTGLEIMERIGSSKVWTLVSTLASDATSFLSDELTPNTQYAYEILAMSGNAASKASAAVTVKTGLLAVTAETPTSVELNWTSSTAAATAFKIERKSATAGAWTVVATVDGNTVSPNFAGGISSTFYSYSDSGLSASTRYVYQVIPMVATKAATPSNLANVTTLPPPSAPSDLSATELSADSIQLSWTDSTDDTAGYSVQRHDSSSGVWTTVATLNANTTTFSDTNLQAGTQYTYEIIATSGGASSSPSNQATAVTLPATPGNLTVSSVSVNTIQLSWVNDPSNLAGFMVEREDGNSGVWNLDALIVDPTVTSYDDMNLQPGMQYSYQVIATDGDLLSEPSNVVAATTLPAAATGLVATPVSTTSIQLSWSDSSSNETGFQILRQLGNSGNWTLAGTVSAGVMTYTDSNLQDGTQYTYEVVAVNNGTTSSPSSGNTTSTLPTTPSNLTANPLTANSIQLTWSDSSANETGFEAD